MATKTPAQKANELITLYIKLWTERYGKKPVLNRYKYKWAFQDMIDDLGYDNAHAVVEFFFKTESSGHTLDKIAYNYDELHKVREQLDEQSRKAAILREETRKRVEAFERRTEGS